MSDPISMIALSVLTLLAAASAAIALGRVSGRWRRGAGNRAEVGLLLAVAAGAAAVFAYRAAVIHQRWLALEAHVDGLVLIACFLALALAFLQIGRRLPSATAVGGPLLVLILAWAICASAWTYTPFVMPPQHVRRIWTAVHLLAVYGGTFFVALAAVAGTMFLLVRRRLRRKAANSATPLASLEALEGIIVRTSALGFALLTLGLASGVVIVASGPSTLGGGWWYSVRVLLALVVWLIYALLMNIRRARAFRGPRAAWLSICGLVLLLLIFALANAVARTAAAGAGAAPAQPPAGATTLPAA